MRFVWGISDQRRDRKSQGMCDSPAKIALRTSGPDVARWFAMRTRPSFVLLASASLAGCSPQAVGREGQTPAGPRPTRTVIVDEPKLSGCTAVPEHLRVYYPCKGGRFGVPVQKDMWTRDTWTKDRPNVPR